MSLKYVVVADAAAVVVVLSLYIAGYVAHEPWSNYVAKFYYSIIIISIVIVINYLHIPLIPLPCYCGTVLSINTLYREVMMYSLQTCSFFFFFFFDLTSAFKLTVTLYFSSGFYPGFAINLTTPTLFTLLAS